jgi:hypothetical protein
MNFQEMMEIEISSLKQEWFMGMHYLPCKTFSIHVYLKICRCNKKPAWNKILQISTTILCILSQGLFCILNYIFLKGRPSAAVKLLPCDHEVMD